MATTNRFGLTAEQRAANLVELLKYADGWIMDPGDWAGTADETVTVADEEGSEDFGPTMHECPEPRVTQKWWAARAA